MVQAQVLFDMLEVFDGQAHGDDGARRYGVLAAGISDAPQPLGSMTCESTYGACSHHSPASACCRNAMKFVTVVDTSLGDG